MRDWKSLIASYYYIIDLHIKICVTRDPAQLESRLNEVMTRVAGQMGAQTVAHNVTVARAHVETSLQLK